MTIWGGSWVGRNASFAHPTQRTAIVLICAESITVVLPTRMSIKLTMAGNEGHRRWNGDGSSQRRAASPKWRPVAAVHLSAVPLRSSRTEGGDNWRLQRNDREVRRWRYTGGRGDGGERAALKNRAQSSCNNTDAPRRKCEEQQEAAKFDPFPEENPARDVQAATFQVSGAQRL
ncbi:hypothetical protein C8J57DRAFT_1214176 [Mycena rebaudengoi]|nr:hypothetical protein C8J57DRAFT_1214176 [Mycena rebaudengoi]